MMGDRVVPGGWARKYGSKAGIAAAGVLAVFSLASAVGATRPAPPPPTSLQTAMLEWPRTDTGEVARISPEAMTALAVQQLFRAGIAETDFGLAIEPVEAGHGGSGSRHDMGASLPGAAVAQQSVSGAVSGALSPVAGTVTPLLQVSHQAGIPFNPASTMKLVTTYAALSMLGPGYHWNTRFLTTGEIRGGVLYGDLILQGGGDPHLVIEDLHALMADLRARGLQTIRGDLVIDDARFAVGPTDGTPFDGDASQAYNVRPWAALTNFKASRLVIDPARRQLTLDPPLADVQLRYDVRVLKGRCRPGMVRLGMQEATQPGGRPVVSVHGTQMRSCGTQQFYAAMLDHRQFLHGIFKAAWQDMGGRLVGRTRIEPGAAAHGKFLYAWQSSFDLGEVVYNINKFSNNVMTRMLLLEMAAAAGNGAMEPEQAGQWLHHWYQGQGLAMPSLTMENGSGLSRNARISAGDMVALLVRAAASPAAQWFESSLPVVGIDGTMKTRLRLDPVAGQAQIKTGTLQDVRAIAGYVTAASGRRYALSLIINGKYASDQALHAQDELLRWVYRYG